MSKYVLQIALILLSRELGVVGWLTNPTKLNTRIYRTPIIPVSRYHHTTLLASSSAQEDTHKESENLNGNSQRGGTQQLQKVIHWRGEKELGNSLQFRHLEFKSVLDISTSCNAASANSVDFSPALASDFSLANEMTDYERHAYENAMQYLDVDHDHEETYSNKDLIEAGERCSLIRSIYEIVAEGDTFEELAKNALESGNLHDMMANGTNAEASWRVSLRQYGRYAKIDKQKQYGKKMRSPMTSEREAMIQMKDFFTELVGPVDLKNANVSLYLFEGLVGRQKVLARVLTRGANTSIIAPKTRICVTNTPLCPLAAFTMNNVARIKSGSRIFDPFAGSCTILLAASMIEPTVRSVGCDIAHNGQVNRNNILEDFISRNLTVPSAIIRGDSMLKDVRNQAQAAVGDAPFDAIITDPPYGIREKTGYCLDPPLVNLVKCIAKDRTGEDGKRLLKVGGRLVAFVPNQEGDDICLDMPTDHDLSLAGLEFVQMLEQPLNDSLSRWLVEYKCIQ